MTAPLTDINTGNVSGRTQAWSVQLSQPARQRGPQQSEGTSIVVNGMIAKTG